MPAPLDPDDEEVVVLVHGRGSAARRPPPRRRQAGDGRPAPPPGSSSGRGDGPDRQPQATRPVARGGVPVVGAPAPVASPVQAPGTPTDSPRRWGRKQAKSPEQAKPPKQERSPRQPKRPRIRPEGSFLRGHVRVPGTLGLVIVVLALATGTGFVGAYIWARNDARNIRSSPVAPPPLRRTDAAGPAEVTTTTKPDLSADTLVEKLGPSVWAVRTFDSAGQPVQGSALLTRSAGGQSLLLTSLAVVEASTHLPAPEITVTAGGFNGKAELWTWDEAHDLALLVVGGTKTPAVDWVADPASVKVGDKVFVLGSDAKVKPGLVTAVSDQAVENNVFVDDALRGGPVVNVKGEVIALSSAVYTAGGAPTDTAFFGVPIRLACAQVLTCSGAFAGSGAEAPATPSSPATTTTTTTTEPA